jgi:hypothetical protein
MTLRAVVVERLLTLRSLSLRVPAIVGSSASATAQHDAGTNDGGENYAEPYGAGL